MQTSEEYLLETYHCRDKYGTEYSSCKIKVVKRCKQVIQKRKSRASIFTNFYQINNVSFILF
jgi:hypothetical protein